MSKSAGLNCRPILSVMHTRHPNSSRWRALATATTGANCVSFESARGIYPVALDATAGEPRCDFSHITVLDRLAAQRAERLRARGPAIDQDKLHGCLLVRRKAAPGG